MTLAFVQTERVGPSEVRGLTSLKTIILLSRGRLVDLHPEKKHSVFEAHDSSLPRNWLNTNYSRAGTAEEREGTMGFCGHGRWDLQRSTGVC